MGKEKKAKSSSKVGGTPARNMGLADQILDDKSVRTKSRQKTRDRNDGADDFVDDKTTKKILAQARKQQAELEEEHGIGSSKAPSKQHVSLGEPDNDSSEEEDFSDNEDYYEEIKLSEEDEKAMEMFMSEDQKAKRTLHDIIREALTEKKTEINAQMTDCGSVCMDDLDERVVKMYQQVKTILVKYRSGKLPKAFKAIPSLRNWEQVLDITEPENWSAAAVYQATRIFASNLNAKMAQRFYNLVLLPRVRDDIREYKRLNYHLYQALKKSLFKPAAFFKGILLPLCEGDCTLREALIIGSVLTKCSIPMLHSAAALMKIADMEYYGANSMFLRVLLDKKYTLPCKVLDSVVDHFVKFQRDPREAPVLWHQSFLTFVQRYKEDISSEQKAALMEVLRAKPHPSITPEIRRELVHAKCRDVEMTEPAMEAM